MRNVDFSTDFNHTQGVAEKTSHYLTVLPVRRGFPWLSLGVSASHRGHHVEESWVKSHTEYVQILDDDRAAVCMIADDDSGGSTASNLLTRDRIPPHGSPRSKMAVKSCDRGSATVWLTGIGLAIVILAASAIIAGQMLLARHRARAAADLGALSGAPYTTEGESIACEYAKRVVNAHKACLLRCDVNGLDLVVTVEIRGFGSVVPIRAAARAGPVRRSPVGE